LINTVYIKMVSFNMIIVTGTFKFMFPIFLFVSKLYDFFWCRVTPNRTPTIFPCPVKFSAFVLLRLSALWLSLLSYSIGNELLTFLAAPSPIFPPHSSIFDWLSLVFSFLVWREFRMRSPEALTFNDEFDTQGHDIESFAVGHLSAPLPWNMPFIASFPWNRTDD